MELESDEDTIEYDIEVVESSSSISLDSDQAQELALRVHDQETAQDALVEPEISKDKLAAGALGAAGSGKIHDDQQGQRAEWEDLERPAGELSSVEWELQSDHSEHGPAEQWEEACASSEAAFETVSSSCNEIEGRVVDIETVAAESTNELEAKVQKGNEFRSVVEIVSANNSVTAQAEPEVADELKAERGIANDQQDSPTPDHVDTISEEPEVDTRGPFTDKAQWFECCSTELDQLAEIADRLLVAELPQALQQVALLADQQVVDLISEFSEPEVELPESFVVVQDEQYATALTEQQAYVARALDEDLEREFDEEPAFEPRHVELKVNCDARTEYMLGEELGRGKFGTVYRCAEFATGLAVAAKFVQLRRREDRDDVRREIEIMSQLQHKRLLQLYDAFDDGAQEMCLVTELVEGGELFERIVNDDFELTEKKAAIFVRQICEGVEYMHSCNIVHLDLKPENILCVSKTGNRIKLIDFGLARKLHPDQPLRVMFGTPDFAAPEVLAYDTVSLATDMWSVGVICYVLLSGLSPFMGDTDMETIANVALATYDFEDQAFEPISDLAKDFIARLLIRDQQVRLQPAECLRHPWLMRGGTQLEAAARGRRLSMALAPQPQQVPLILAEADGTVLSLNLDKRNLKKYVVRRKWHKTVHAIMALGRMGANLKIYQPQTN